MNEYFDGIGMKYEENVNLDDFVNMIKNNCKLKEEDEGKARQKNKSLDMNLKALLLWKMKMEKIVLGKDIKLIKREKSILGKNIKKMRMKKKMGHKIKQTLYIFHPPKKFK